MNGAGDAREFWESRYREREQTWSGRPNQSLVDVVDDMLPGRALDLGCGEGGDSIWLAAQGWSVTAVDVSPTALERARRAATDAGLADNISWRVHDLAAWEPEGEFDLVSACFLQSPVEFPRYEVLRSTAERLAPNGHLLVVAHASAPPWARDRHEGHGPPLLNAEEEVAALSLPIEQWEVVVAENRPRRVTGPDGEQAEILDAVVLVRRR
ncbi:methyltransferase domain-containing protein [Aeromicrobium phragmitis]|uniref:Methyltransferase domain-containing protein n=1 Tax=Aeromicrobium phragmitis TaxID=2478914 RepID=A0A3L8PLD0_9ACTN|nr:methyltransferase domain-containing protein [Aeromicrobium phragmitis]RLV55533.1 methyltransferase domain-containing protein [Aeromicrobium phragmitis]